MAQVRNPTPHAPSVPPATIGSSRSSQAGSPEAAPTRPRPRAVGTLGGWVPRGVARVSLKMLSSRRHRREEPVGGTWRGAAEQAARAAAGDGPGAAAPASLPADPEDEAVLADSVGLALLVV